MAGYDSEALAGLDEWFGRILQNLSPVQRRKASRKLGQQLRAANLKRQQANVEPDGAAMEPRKPRIGKKRKKVGGPGSKGGKMFRRLRFARRWSIDARPDSVEIAPKGRASARLAEVHHFGLEDIVGYDREGRAIRYKYPRRRLLGFDRDDEQAVLDVASDLLDPDS